MDYYHILLCGGVGSRLKKEYSLDKPLNLIKGIPLINRIIECIPSEKLLIIVGSHLIKYQIDTIVHHMTKKKVEVVYLDRPTRGPVETAYLGLKKSNFIHDNKPIIFYDNDTLYKGINLPNLAVNSIGYIGLKDKNKNYPYCFLKINNGVVKSIHEKQRVSNQYAAGIYTFSSKKYFLNKALDLIKNQKKNELFMSTLYQTLLDSDEKIESFKVEEGICLGTIEDINRNINKVKSKKLRICFDLDNTILKYRLPNESYADCKPINENLELLKKLYSEGHIIIIHTARGMATSFQNEGASLRRVGKDTFDILEKYKIPFHEIFFGKPNADIYIDDKAYNPFEDIYNLIGFPHFRKKYINPTNKYNSISYGQDYVIKEGPEFSMKGEISFYESISKFEEAKFFPKFKTAELIDKKAYLKLERINGCTLFKILEEGLMDSYHLDNILKAFEKIHNIKTENNTKPEEIYENYIGKLKKRINDNEDYPFINKFELVNLIEPIIKNYIFSRNFKINSIIHGDPWFSNIMIDTNSDLKFIDMKGDVAGNITTNGDAMADYAKILQSLLGFDYIVNDLDPNENYLLPLQNYYLEKLKDKGFDIKVLQSITICMIAKTISFFEVNSPHKKLIWGLVESLSDNLK